jgi:metallophosphoesterase (TIGR00282 family)
MNLLFLGDLVGRSGRQAVIDCLPFLKKHARLDGIIVNAENAAGGFGINEAITQELFEAGADVITLGNHAFDQKEALVFIERYPELLRPANYPPGTPGRGNTLVTLHNGKRLLVANIMGRVFMNAMDDPFRTAERIIEECPLRSQADAIVIDFHAEATSEKQAFAHFLDGKVSFVVGTHTHVPTSDYRILSKGTAYISDAGMCGDYDSVLGMDKEEPVQRFLSQIHGARFGAALGEATICGVAVQVDDKTGLSKTIEPLSLFGALQHKWPSFLTGEQEFLASVLN